jgi:cell wall-associated NlpC family hydrolase
MVWPPFAMVTAPLADLRASPGGTSELVDQVHYHEQPRVLASDAGWHFVQADDHYFGWIRSDAVEIIPGLPQWRTTSVMLAPVRADPREDAEILGHLPAGSPLSKTWPDPTGPWAIANLGHATGYVSHDHTVVISELPHRPPTRDDLIATAEAFLGVPYLWGGTTAAGMDCSGFVQQVYRLNGVRLDRDAHQQAVEGRPVDVPARGDLVFFGDPAITHVGIALDERTMLNALGGKAVERDAIDGIGVGVLAVRRYLP